MFRSLTTLYIFTLSKSVPMWRGVKFFKEKLNFKKECVKTHIINSRNPLPCDSGFPLWMWGVKEKDMAVAFATI